MDQGLHTCLKTDCSSLNQHLFRRNLVPNPYCSWDEIENNKHFLLACPRYNQMRGKMILSIRQKRTWNLQQMFCSLALRLIWMGPILQYLRQCIRLPNSPNDSLTKFNEMMLTLLDRFFWILRIHDKQLFCLFIVCAIGV